MRQSVGHVRLDPDSVRCRNHTYPVEPLAEGSDVELPILPAVPGHHYEPVDGDVEVTEQPDGTLVATVHKTAAEIRLVKDRPFGYDEEERRQFHPAVGCTLGWLLINGVPRMLFVNELPVWLGWLSFYVMAAGILAVFLGCLMLYERHKTGKILILGTLVVYVVTILTSAAVALTPVQGPLVTLPNADPVGCAYPGVLELLDNERNLGACDYVLSRWAHCWIRPTAVPDRCRKETVFSAWCQTAEFAGVRQDAINLCTE